DHHLVGAAADRDESRVHERAPARLSFMYPNPPWSWVQGSATEPALRPEEGFAIQVSLLASSPAPRLRTPQVVTSRAAVIWVSISTNLNCVTCILESGFLKTTRSSQ